MTEISLSPCDNLVLKLSTVLITHKLKSYIPYNFIQYLYSFLK